MAAAVGRAERVVRLPVDADGFLLLSQAEPLQRQGLLLCTNARQELSRLNRLTLRHCYGIDSTTELGLQLHSPLALNHTLRLDLPRVAKATHHRARR